MDKKVVISVLKGKLKEILDVFINVDIKINSGVTYFCFEAKEEDLMLLNKRDFDEALKWLMEIYNGSYKRVNVLYASLAPSRWKEYIENNSTLPEIVQLRKRLDAVRLELAKRPYVMKKGKLREEISKRKKKTKSKQ